MVRVAGLKGHQLQGVEDLSADGMTATQQLDAIAEQADSLVVAQQAEWILLREALADEGLEVVGEDDLTDGERDWLADHFREQILPVLTPQAIDPSHPFPFIPNGGFSLIFDLRRGKKAEPVVELLMIPPTLPRFVRLPGPKLRFISIENVDPGSFRPALPGLRQGRRRRVPADPRQRHRSPGRSRGSGPLLPQRDQAPPARPGHPPGVRRRHAAQSGGDGPRGPRADTALVAESAGFIGIADLGQLVEVDRPDLKFPPYTPRFPERIMEHDGDCFAAIRAKDFIVHHPYESFEVVVAFLRQAAEDPDVVAIKQTLYRAGKQSAIIDALVAAAEAGKSVTAVVELKARFDEEQNLLWASRLERAGVQVIYGFVEWKTHAKVSMVIRREGSVMRTYCHFGTGNYHPTTAKIYTDLSYFTASRRAARDAAKLFNLTTGYVQPKGLELLTLSPHGHARQDHWP